MDPASHRLTRRAFVRGALLTGVAAVATTRWHTEGAVAGARVVPGDGIPRLDLGEPIVGVAAGGDRVVAIGGRSGIPRTWTCRPGDAAWREVTTEPGLPPGAGVTDVTARGAGFVAAGWLEGHDGPRPAVFVADGSLGWRSVELPETAPGICTATASLDDRSLVVGSRFTEGSVREPAAPFAFVGDEAGWAEVTLDGVSAPRHGEVSALGDIGGRLLLATTDVAGTALFTAADARGPWRPVRAPRPDQPFVIMAVAAVDEGVLLAGLDTMDRPRCWVGDLSTWRAAEPPVALDASSHVVGMSDADGSFVAAASSLERAFIEEVSAA